MQQEAVKIEHSDGMSSGLKLHKRANRDYMVVIFALILIVVFSLSFFVGRFSVAPDELIVILLRKLLGLPQTWSDSVNTIVFKIRLPRILAAIFIGAALSLAGATYQGLFKNPMVSPDILGASAGAGFGAALALLLSLSSGYVHISAFLFGIIAVALTYAISEAIVSGGDEILMLILVGIVVSSLFQALISAIKYVADPNDKLPAITFWLMGGLSSVSPNDVPKFILPIIIGSVPLILLRWKLNVLSFGEEEAQAMGVNTGVLRLVTITCSTLITAAAVSAGGLIGWVGLVIPHLARMLVGPNNKKVLPLSIVIGSTYLLFIDDLARSMLSTEIPLGILTSIIGAPFFIVLLLRRKKKWGQV